MDKEKRLRLNTIRSKVRNAFDVTSDEFKSQSPTASEAKKAFVLLARTDGFTNPEIGNFLGSSPKSISNFFANATKLSKQDDIFSRELHHCAETLNIDLSKT